MPSNTTAQLTDVISGLETQEATLSAQIKEVQHQRAALEKVITMFEGDGDTAEASTTAKKNDRYYRNKKESGNKKETRSEKSKVNKNNSDKEEKGWQNGRLAKVRPAKD